MIFTKVVRLWNGPSFRGLKPILVTFHLFKDKEDILRKSPLLRGTNIYITEDYSRKVRKHREELLRFAKLVKARQNGVRCLLQYDRLYVGTVSTLRCFNDNKFWLIANFKLKFDYSQFYEKYRFFFLFSALQDFSNNHQIKFF